MTRWSFATLLVLVFLATSVSGSRVKAETISFDEGATLDQIMALHPGWSYYQNKAGKATLAAGVTGAVLLRRLRRRLLACLPELLVSAGNGYPLHRLQPEPRLYRQNAFETGPLAAEIGRPDGCANPTDRNKADHSDDQHDGILDHAVPRRVLVAGEVD